MQVKVQDCGCIALPDEVLVELGVGAGSVLELVLSQSTRSVTLAALDERVGAPQVTGACAIGMEQDRTGHCRTGQ